MFTIQPRKMISSFFIKLLKKLLSIAVLTYLSLLAIGYFYSDKLIFLPQSPSYSWDDARSKNLIRIQSQNASDPNTENTIVAYFAENPNATYTILYSHGNAVDIGGLQHLQQNFYNNGYSILVYDYSGYGLSEGQASEQQVYNDVQAVYSYLLQQQLTANQIISYGHSLGAAIATELALRNPVAALVLESPFTSAFRVKTTYAIAPFDKFISIDKIDKINTPLFIVHSKDDHVIPFWHSEVLFEKANPPKQFYWFETGNHSGITHKEVFWKELANFVSSF